MPSAMNIGQPSHRTQAESGVSAAHFLAPLDEHNAEFRPVLRQHIAQQGEEPVLEHPQ